MEISETGVYLHQQNKQTMTQSMPIGVMKASKMVYCTICSSSLKRNISVYVYENTPAAIEAAKSELNTKACQDYTCRICKSIKKAA